MANFKPQKKTQESVKFIRNVVARAGFSKVIVSLSGGIDSTTVVFLATQALGKENVLVTILPYGDLNKEGADDAKEVVKIVEIPKTNVFEIDIKPAVDMIAKPAEIPPKTSTPLERSRLGSIMARIRMIILFDLAKKQKALVCGTENKSEYLLGYFTRFGDSASDIEPIKGFYKTQVRELAQYLGVPKKIIEKPPTAGLWQGQADETELGFSYKEADKILELLYDKKWSLEKIIGTGYKKELVEKIKKRVEETEFMRK